VRFNFFRGWLTPLSFGFLVFEWVLFTVTAFVAVAVVVVVVVVVVAVAFVVVVVKSSLIFELLFCGCWLAAVVNETSCIWRSQRVHVTTRDTDQSSNAGRPLESPILRSEHKRKLFHTLCLIWWIWNEKVK